MRSDTLKYIFFRRGGGGFPPPPFPVGSTTKLWRVKLGYHLWLKHPTHKPCQQNKEATKMSYVVFKAAVRSTEVFKCQRLCWCMFSVFCPCTFQALSLVDTDQSGYIAFALIGQNQGYSQITCRFVQSKAPTGLSVYKSTDAGINSRKILYSRITVPGKVFSPLVSTKTL